ncbi:hypothetical protein QBC46DRAFT_270867 [Diplogelasinospora grovesii]|uniref:Uncharacterized protein n=1 Tax=Diplogelasinospora grovesii TaxID=303347 RepID=A0AAN6S0E3_9PEZI|nr:hypothetical protein QBC46DRAFT_270867 [Diplogelasinospora grovesii]
MCTYYYIHYHHIPPCAKGVEMQEHTVFCEWAPTDQSTGFKQRCNNVHYDTPQHVDPSNLCFAGVCFRSPDCSEGRCRLEELGRWWVCCHCSRGGNEYLRCSHRMRQAPDTLCYHLVCSECTADHRVVQS